jgi:hypothetical protein
MSLLTRIDDALSGGPMSFYDLAVRLYPSRGSHRGAVQGGPPGCYMALSAAIRRGGFYEKWKEPGPGNRIVYPRRGTNVMGEFVD